jgi:hypothetical protein
MEQAGARKVLSPLLRVTAIAKAQINKGTCAGMLWNSKM